MISQQEKIIRQKLKDDFVHYAEKCLKIRSEAGSIISFTLNKAQKFIHQRLEQQKESIGYVRCVLLKGRQQGSSTYVGARFYHQVTHKKGMQAFILTHSLDATQNLYKMAQRFYEYTPSLVKPEVRTSNAKELVFGLLDSGYKLGTAENKAVGRSSTIQLLHGSEVAFWANAEEHAKGIMQAVPGINGTEIILESTANGVGNYFHQQWQRAEAKQSDFIAIFVPWFWQDKYKKRIIEPLDLTPEEIEFKQIYHINDEQINWRRNKVAELSISGIDGEKAFKQEYPFNPNEAFQLTGEDSYIESDLIMKARKTTSESYGLFYIGVDPARFGDDRTSIIRRKGRVAYGLESYIKKDTMEITGIVNKIIQEEKPDKVFIDVGGLGAGIVDRLNELGYKNIISPVNSGSKPLNANKYSNKRTEMWGEMKLWLIDDPCQIPDVESLHADLCGVKYKFDSNSRLVLEKKEEMKKRGLRSSDEADALALTFAYPPKLQQLDSKSTNVAAKIMKTQDEFLRAKELLYYVDSP